jgi:REP element-mobilizing transposase RayT
MPRSWTQNYYHIVFSTKRREQTVSSEIEARLYPFVGGILKDLRCATLAINGMPDHLHALVRYPPDLSHSDMLQNVKGRSSRWVGETFPGSSWRGWQEGFGGFTVSRSLVPRVEDYIIRQKEHHLRHTYEQEVIELHRLHDMPFIAEDVLD